MSESELETELRNLRPAAPSQALEGAIARGLAGHSRALVVRPTAGLIVRPKPQGQGLWRGLLWALGGAVTAALVFSFLPRPMQLAAPLAATEAAAATGFEAVESAREVVATETSEIFHDNENEPAQVVRYSSVERHRWTNPETGALVELEVPREDIVLVQLSYQ